MKAEKEGLFLSFDPFSNEVSTPARTECRHVRAGGFILVAKISRQPSLSPLYWAFGEYRNKVEKHAIKNALSIFTGLRDNML
ncbi:MAG: hypothetical protein K9J27_03255 [Bacteroidales bacterium]|nr:hypothetical protein [Bacteroidales bacterium]MCF8332792.1 hypothetical protein [Bacteroidales bacterium]